MRTMSRKLALSIAAYIAAIVLANLMTAHLGLVPIGLGFTVTAGTFAAGFALLARDWVHGYGGIKWALASVLVGAALSWYLATPQLAIASTVAFVAAELVDMAVYVPLRKTRGFIAAAIISNIVSAPIDTALFLHLAGFPVTLESISGQFVAKVIWATLLPVAIYALGRHALLRQSINAKGS